MQFCHLQAVFNLQGIEMCKFTQMLIFCKAVKYFFSGLGLHSIHIGLLDSFFVQLINIHLVFCYL